MRQSADFCSVWVGIAVVGRKRIIVERMYIHVYMGLVATCNSAHKIRDVL